VQHAQRTHLAAIVGENNCSQTSTIGITPKMREKQYRPKMSSKSLRSACWVDTIDASCKPYQLCLRRRVSLYDGHAKSEIQSLVSPRRQRMSIYDGSLGFTLSPGVVHCVEVQGSPYVFGHTYNSGFGPWATSLPQP
jgi:hypothetical protein